MTEDLIRTLIFGMPSRLNPDAADGVDAVIQFMISGTQGGKFAIRVHDKLGTAEEGVHPNPTLTLKMSAETYMDMAMGRVSGPQAFFKRKVKILGDMGLAMKLHTLFPSLGAQSS